MALTLKERLEEALAKNPELSKSGLAKACDVRQPSVSDWFNGRTKRLTGENLLNAARYLGVSDSWLATGKGPMTGEKGHDQGPSQPMGLDDETMAQGLELLYLMADARLQRPSWAMIKIAAKAVQRAEDSPREAMAAILAELSKET